MRFSFWRIAIGLLVIAGIAGATVALRRASFSLKVAATPATPETLRSMQVLGRDAATENSWISFERVPVSSTGDAAKALSERRVDLAVLRGDTGLPRDVQTIGILRRDSVFLIAPPKSSLSSFRDLRNQKVGMLPSIVDNTQLLDRLLDFYGVAPGSVSRIPVQPGDVAAALQQKRISAVLVVGVPGKGMAAEVFASVSRSTRGTPEIIAVEEGEAVAAKLPGFEAGEIPKGALGGRAPDEATTTVTVAYHLLSNRKMNNFVAGELARLLMAARTRLQSDPAIAGIEAPDTEQSNYAIHPGAKAFYDGEQEGWLDSISNIFWIGSMVIGVLGSALTWLLGRLRGRAEAMTEGLGRLLPFLEEVRKADAGRLDELSDRLNEVVGKIISEQQAGKLHPDEIGAYQLAINYARQAINDRRSRLRPAAGGA